MNYENMSDFEINKVVATTWLPCDYDFDDKAETVDLVRYATYLGAHGIADERLEKYGEFNPCNNPADAWPIILENKMSIMNNDEAWEASIDFDGDLNKHGTDEVLTKHIEDENPLRAAMIVFLMMNKGE